MPYGGRRNQGGLLIEYLIGSQAAKEETKALVPLVESQALEADANAFATVMRTTEAGDTPADRITNWQKFQKATNRRR